MIAICYSLSVTCYLSCVFCYLLSDAFYLKLAMTCKDLCNFFDPSTPPIRKVDDRGKKTREKTGG